MTTKTVVVTGASSFVGAHLARSFAKAGYRTIAVHSLGVAAYEGIRAARLEVVRNVADLRRLDITDESALTSFIDGVMPDLWIHHAGFAEGYASPDYDLARGMRVNVAPLAPLYARLSGSGCGVIVTGSDAEYGNSDDAHGEEESCLPETPYGLSKLAETLRTRQLALHHDVPTRVARLFIPFGEMDNPAKLLPSVLRSLREGVAMDLSPCTQKRDFVGVGDLGSAWSALAEDLPRALFDIFNICGGSSVELRSLLLDLAKALGADEALLRFGACAMRPSEAMVSYGSNEKARRLLGWSPRPLSQSLQEDLIA